MSCLLIRILAWKSPLEKKTSHFPSEKRRGIPLAGAGRASLRPRGVARARSRHSFCWIRARIATGSGLQTFLSEVAPSSVRVLPACLCAAAARAKHSNAASEQFLFGTRCRCCQGGRSRSRGGAGGVHSNQDLSLSCCCFFSARLTALGPGPEEKGGTGKKKS